MDIATAMKLIDLGFTTDQIREFESPAAPAPEPSPVVEPAAPAPAVEAQPTPIIKTEPIDYKKLAEEVALYNQKNSRQPEAPKVEPQPEPEPQPKVQDVLLNFLG